MVTNLDHNRTKNVTRSSISHLFSGQKQHLMFYHHPLGSLFVSHPGFLSSQIHFQYFKLGVVYAKCCPDPNPRMKDLLFQLLQLPPRGISQLTAPFRDCIRKGNCLTQSYSSFQVGCRKQSVPNYLLTRHIQAWLSSLNLGQI